jgi:hypothetical protein
MTCLLTVMDSLVYEMNIEDMPKKENQVACSYIHPFIRALCKLGINYTPHCSMFLIITIMPDLITR